MKTRIRHLSDGAREVIRLISPKDLDGFDKDDPLLFEKSIVWLEDIAPLLYVRVYQVRCAKSRRGRLRLSGRERVVGYAKLMADAPRDPRTKGYTRRLFYLNDADARCLGPLPDRVVDPRTVFPGIRGKPPSDRERQADSP